MDCFCLFRHRASAAAFRFSIFSIVLSYSRVKRSFLISPSSTVNIAKMLIRWRFHSDGVSLEQARSMASSLGSEAPFSHTAHSRSKYPARAAAGIAVTLGLDFHASGYHIIACGFFISSHQHPATIGPVVEIVHALVEVVFGVTIP